MPKRSRTFAAGVLILSAANLLVKIFGMFYKIPLVHLLGDGGMGYFNTAYTLYTLFYTISTAGLPAAFSLTVSSICAQNSEKAVGKVLSRGLCFFSCVGLLGMLLLFFLSDPLADLIGNPAAAAGIRAISPVLLLSCVSSVLRGYFQGKKKMLPSAVSQVLEAFGKLLVGLLFSIYALRKGFSLPIVSAFALLGVTVSSLVGTVSLAFSLLWEKVREKKVIPSKQKSTAVSVEEQSFKQQIGDILKVAFPITVTSSVLSLTGILDLTTVLSGLQRSGLSLSDANVLYGNYTGLVIPLFNLPPVLMYPLANTALPFISGALAKGQKEEAVSYLDKAIRQTLLIGIPASFGLSALALPILKLIFPVESAELAAPLLRVLAPACLFVGLLSVSGAVLQAYGHPRLPILSMLLGGSVKILTSFFLIPQIGIYGAPIGTLLCYVLATGINVLFLIRKTGYRPKFTVFLLKVLLSAAVCVLVAVGCLYLTVGLGKIGTLLAVASAVVSYGIALLLLGVVYIKRKDHKGYEIRS